MQKNNESSQLRMLENSPLQASWQVKLDLQVLRYMAHRIHRRLLSPAVTITLPSLEYIEERRKRIHRMVIYQQQEYLLRASLLFVGFVSGVQSHVSPAIAQEIHRVDKLFMAELVHNAGLLSYSSLELNAGHWYNLVLLSDVAAKTYFKESSTHRYAAYDLAMHYYAWIRLHNGIMPNGLEGNVMLLQSTKSYTFPVIGQKPVMQELLYPVKELP
ncbi:MAG TPA: hypothetical protein VJO32_16280 [Ktedonobacteraceae bacterium]|nr:hypothetical protein [Ktedonobacteraceae bacterium]